MKKIYLVILLCSSYFLSISCVAFTGIAITSTLVTNSIVTIADSIVNKDDGTGPSFIFPEDADSKKYANIGSDIKIYSDNAEWRPNDKYYYVIGKVVPGGSAELAGIKEGGILYNINGRFTERMSPHETLSYLIGGGEETIPLYIIDNKTGLLKKFEVPKTIN